MLSFLMSAAFASTLAVPTAPLDCPTSALWKKVNETALDQEAPGETSAVPVTIGCTFVEPPGAVVNLTVNDDALAGLTVIGIRRGLGQLVVAATPEQAAFLEQSGTVTTKVVKGGDWQPLLEEVDRARRSHP